MSDSFCTTANDSRVELKVKGSEFIADVFGVSTLADVDLQLSKVRKREYDATHHCYAWRLRLPNDSVQAKSSDDGEPSGTAGRPILDLLTGRELVNALVVVTRYFGGTKLGTGPLARAYSDAAGAALDRAGTREVFLQRKVELSFDFPLYERLIRLLQKSGATVVSSEFTDTVTLDVTIRRSLYEPLLNDFRELTAGRGKHRSLDE